MLEEKESFWKKKGFYLSVCAAILCILGIGTVYYKINYQNNNDKNLFADSATTSPNNITDDVTGNSAINEAKNNTTSDNDSEDAVSVAQNNTQQNTSNVQPTTIPDSTPDSSANSQNDQNSQNQDTSNENKSADNDNKKDNTSEKYVADANTTKKTKKVDSVKTAKIKDSEINKGNDKGANSTDNTVATMKDTSTKDKFDMEKGLLWPVNGDIILKYSMNNTVYFKTLAQYKCNPAVIISSKEGTNVKAAADGTVSKITKSDEVGNLITVDIGNGYSVTYGQIDEISVKEGQYVEEGSVIAQIAKPTKYYSEEGSNLYLQVTENDKPVDPMLLLR